jgi:hypothetical protein
MTDTTYNVITPDHGVPINAWTKGVPFEDAARQQLLNVPQFIYKRWRPCPTCIGGKRLVRDGRCKQKRPERFSAPAFLSGT